MSKVHFNICNVEMVSDFFVISSQLQVVIYEVTPAMVGLLDRSCWHLVAIGCYLLLL